MSHLLTDKNVLDRLWLTTLNENRGSYRKTTTKATVMKQVASTYRKSVYIRELEGRNTQETKTSNRRFKRRFENKERTPSVLKHVEIRLSNSQKSTNQRKLSHSTKVFTVKSTKNCLSRIYKSTSDGSDKRFWYWFQ